jgi:hypothetical protein
MFHHLRAKVVFAILCLVTCVSSAAGGEHHDPTGFSLVYPDGWFAITNIRDVTKAESMPAGIRAWLDKHPVDLGKARLLVVRDGEDDFLENVNVVMVDQQQPANDSSLKTLLKMLPQQFSSLGLKVEDLQGRIQKLGANEAIVFDYRFVLPGTETKLRQTQAHIPGGGKTYIFTCTAKADSFAAAAGTFDTILASVKVPAPIAQGFTMTPVLRGALIGGIAGALLVLFKRLAGSRAKTA